VSHAFEANYARRLLADPHYSTILEEVDTEKPEVLGQPKIAGEVVDDQGKAKKAATPQDKKDA